MLFRSTGGAGNDTFVARAGMGADVVTDFLAGIGSGDQIAVSMGSAFDTYAEVMAAAHQDGTDTVIDFGGGNSLTLQNVQIGDLVADDFRFA